MLRTIAAPQISTQPRSPRRRSVGRKTIVAAVALAVAATSFSAAPAFAAPTWGPSSGDSFDIPSSAVVRSLGDIPAGSCQGVVAPGCNPAISRFLPYTTPGLGIPLGGIGAGSFMINQSGTFGPWNFGGSQGTSYEVRSLPQAAFHVREQIGNRPATTRTLATDGPKDATLPATRSWADPLPAWNTLNKGDASYAALYPFGWMSYAHSAFDNDVSMRFYSPIVAGEEKRTSLPVAYFDVRIANNTRKTANVSTMFTMPNVPGHEGRQPATVREGLSSQYREDPKTGIQAVTLSSDSAANTPDADKSEWTIAADIGKDQKFSYLTSWNANGDGSDVYKQFAATGTLSDSSLDSSASAGAIAVSAKLKPGQTTVIPFALTWDFPEVGFANNNTVWMRRYTQYYGAQTTASNDSVPGSYPFHQSYNIAKDALQGRSAALRDVLAWWKPIVDSPQVPAAIGAAAMNQLANVTFHTDLWENGLVRNSVPVTKGGQRIGSAVPGTHNYFGTDSIAGGVSTQGQGGEIGIYSSNVYSRLFPFIERDRMRAKAEQIMVSDDGDPQDFSVTGSVDPAVYGVDGDPFITWNPHNQSSNNSASGAGLTPAPGTMSFLDRVSDNVFRMYDYARRNHDPAFLRFAFPAMKQALGLLQKTIPTDSVLPEPTSQARPQPGNVQQFANVYDVVPTDRFDSYTSGLYLLTLETIIASGQTLGEPRSQIATWKSQLTAAKAEYESVFWNNAGGYYRYTLPQNGVDEVMLNTLLPQYLAETAGLPEIVDVDHYARHLQTMYPLVAGANGPKLVGLPGGGTTYPFTGPQGNVFEPNVIPGAVYSAAANYIDAGVQTHNRRLIKQGLSMTKAVNTQLWATLANGYQFDTPFLYSSQTPSSWIYPSFENNLSIWQLIDVLKKPGTPAVGALDVP